MSLNTVIIAVLFTFVALQSTRPAAPEVKPLFLLSPWLTASSLHLRVQRRIHPPLGFNYRRLTSRPHHRLHCLPPMRYHRHFCDHLRSRPSASLSSQTTPSAGYNREARPSFWRSPSLNLSLSLSLSLNVSMTRPVLAIRYHQLGSNFTCIDMKTNRILCPP